MNEFLIIMYYSNGYSFLFCDKIDFVVILYRYGKKIYFCMFIFFSLLFMY